MSNDGDTDKNMKPEESSGAGEAAEHRSRPKTNPSIDHKTTFEIIDAGEATDSSANKGLSNLRLTAYNPEQFHDEARRDIAKFLLWILAGVVIAVFCGLFWVCDKPSIEQYKSVVELLLSPLIALVSAATGFYFGSKKS